MIRPAHRVTTRVRLESILRAHSIDYPSSGPTAAAPQTAARVLYERL
jgi:hypothetical protein